MAGYRNESTDRLMDILATLDSREACYAFMEDLCTIRELLDMSQRFDTALLLSKGENYQEICKKVGTSTATVSRVSRCLNYGSGGYRAVIDALKKPEEEA